MQECMKQRTKGQQCLFNV